ncbi:MAG: amidohydrolase/deacetylase family metallohydrolase [Cyclobacteriaceae bacterium]
MNRILRLLFFCLLSFSISLSSIQAQNYDIVIKGGHVIDPKNDIDEVMDVAITGNTVALIEKNINTESAQQVVTAEGMYVMPGLIDLHSHNFYGTEPEHAYSNGFSALAPDGFTFRNGVTTVVDAGGSGWKSFSTFKEQTIDHSRTRVLAFLNIVGEGMRGGEYEQNVKDMDAQKAAAVAKENSEFIVGFKVAHFSGPDWTPVDHAVEAGKMAGDIPVMIDFGGSDPPLSIEELFMEHLRPGDIFTHCFGELGSRESIVDRKTKEVKPFVWEAQKKGIIFDVGYGGISFAFSQAIPALKSEFYPNTISTDIHIGSMNNAMKDMLSVMSKFLVMGMELQPVIEASTWKPAQVIHREELGNLSQGAIADVAILSIREGDFGFFDYTGYKIEGNKKFECEMTIKDGKIVYDLNGIANPVVIR